MSRKILIAVDESQYGRAAFDWYVNHMKKDGDEVHLIHVHNLHDLPTPARYILDPAYLQAVQGETMDSLSRKRSMVIDYMERLKELQVSCKGHLAKNATHVGHEICLKADQIQPLCIVMGSRGMNSLRRTLLGSTSDYVLHHSPYPIAVVKHGELTTDDKTTSTYTETHDDVDIGVGGIYESL